MENLINYFLKLKFKNLYIKWNMTKPEWMKTRNGEQERIKFRPKINVIKKKIKKYFLSMKINYFLNFFLFYLIKFKY